MERMRWYLLVERVWHPELEVSARATVTGLKGAARTEVVKARESAQALLKTLFPADEE